MRFAWIRDYVNGEPVLGLHYELYRPWTHYDVVVFMKSMDRECLQLAKRLKRKGTKVVFDLNVDYFTEPYGTYYYKGMQPTAKQQAEAIEMARLSDGIIGDSRHLAQVSKKHNKNVQWVSDNVLDTHIVADTTYKPIPNDRLPVLWCGVASKLFELLLIRDVLITHANNINLKLITNSLDALKSWHEPYRSDFYAMLDQLSYEVIDFTDIPTLMWVFDKGGVAISPRHIDNSYNLGHTEWKIALPMARGRVCLCSDLMSYADVSERADGQGIRICKTRDDWDNAFIEVLSPAFNWPDEQRAACAVVRNHYSTSVVALQHAEWIKEL